MPNETPQPIQPHRAKVSASDERAWDRATDLDGPLLRLAPRALLTSVAGIQHREAPSNWWTPLLSSGGSGKVSNGPGTASFYG
jgi:hypothetical protein